MVCCEPETAGRLPGDDRRRGFGRGERHLGQHAGVDVRGHGDRGVPEHVLHHLHFYPRGEGQCGRTVTEVVQPDRRQPGKLTDQVEDLGDFRRMPRSAVRVREQQIEILPGAAQPRPVRGLDRDLLPKDDHRVRIQRDDTFGRRRLRLRLTGLPTHRTICSTPAARSVSDRFCPHASPRRKPT